MPSLSRRLCICLFVGFPRPSTIKVIPHENMFSLVCISVFNPKRQESWVSPPRSGQHWYWKDSNILQLELVADFFFFFVPWKYSRISKRLPVLHQHEMETMTFSHEKPETDIYTREANNPVFRVLICDVGNSDLNLGVPHTCPNHWAIVSPASPMYNY